MSDRDRIVCGGPCAGRLPLRAGGKVRRGALRRIAAGFCVLGGWLVIGWSVWFGPGVMLAVAQEVSGQQVSAHEVLGEGSETRREVVRAGEFEIETIVTSGEVLVAQPVVLKVVVRGPAESEVRFAALEGPTGDWEIVSVEDEANLPLSDGRRISRRVLELEALLPGEYAVPRLVPEVWMGGARMDLPTLRSSAFDVRVLSALDAAADPRQPRDIQTVVDVAVELAEPSGISGWVWGFVFVGAMGLVGGAWYVVRRRRAITPRQWAVRQLTGLQPSVWDTCEAATGGNELTAARPVGTVWASEMDGTLRRWIGMRTGIPATAMASEEMVETLEAAGLSDGQVEEALRALLGRWDRCRFAGETIDRAERERQWEQARWLIERVEEICGEAGHQRLTGAGGV